MISFNETSSHVPSLFAVVLLLSTDGNHVATPLLRFWAKHNT